MRKMLCEAVKKYISTAKGLPFFYIVGDEEYLSTLEELKQGGLSVVRVSDYCTNEDRFPDIDDLIDAIRTSDVDYKDNKSVVIGLGEYLALKGVNAAENELRRLKNTTLGNARVVLLLRAINVQAISVINEDNKIVGQQRVHIAADSTSSISITVLAPGIGNVDNRGIKKLLIAFEDGITRNCEVSTELSLEKSIIPVTLIDSAFEALKRIDDSVDLDKNLGSDEYWTRLLKETQKLGKGVDGVFDRYSISTDSLESFYENAVGIEFKNWLLFIYLKINTDKLKNSYLRYVLGMTVSFEEFIANVLNAIIDVSHEDERFRKYYDERKKLVRGFHESEIAAFIKSNEVDPRESIYHLTDNTLLERKTIIQWVSIYGNTDAVELVYPALSDYLSKYIFSGVSLAEELTEYFDEYKKLKISNHISPSFMSQVEAYAKTLKYARLQTRDSVVSSIKDKNDVFLYWIDAMGVEYLSYISALAKRKGLSMHVEITRADLPTITSKNRKFYDEWSGKKKYKEEKLDDIKHKEKGGYYFTECEYPIHLASELQVIEDAINTAATELAQHHCKSFVIASDHGASRLAVICKQDEKYETDTKGEHSGRCCKMFEGCDLEYFIEENGYIILSDYGKFKGSRAANVEVHGGATLEEVVVPIITLTLKKQTDIIIHVLKENDIYVDRHSGIMVSMYISDVDDKNNIYIIVNGERYLGSALDETHFTFRLKDLRRAKRYIADVYDGSDLIGRIDFVAKGKSGSVNPDFDALF